MLRNNIRGQRRYKQQHGTQMPKQWWHATTKAKKHQGHEVAKAHRLKSKQIAVIESSSEITSKSKSSSTCNYTTTQTTTTTM